MLIDVCIASYRRPDGLERLLRALLKQSLPEGAALHIIVVDNDRLGSARAVVEAFRETNGNVSSVAGVVYDVETEKNISLARNRCLDHCRGDYIAFIDDDEEPQANWLQKLIVTLDGYQADIVMGPVVPVYPEQTPSWIVRYQVFDRKRMRTGESIARGRTGNALIRRPVLDSGDRFDPHFGLSGGEDSDFFRRLTANGARMVWCDEAIVREYVSPERLTLGWLLKRDFRSGGCYYHVFIRHSGIVRWLRWFGLRIVYLSLLLPLVTCCPVMGGKARLFILRKCAANLGQLCRSIGYQYQEYK